MRPGSPSASGSRDMRQKAQLGSWVLAEMGQIDRRRRRRGCAQTSAVYSWHRGLDKPFFIDGELGELATFSKILGRQTHFRVDCCSDC